MKKLYIIPLLVFLFESAFSQDQQTNLEKYWRYRDRLRNNFVVVSPNVETPGMNYPFAVYHKKTINIYGTTYDVNAMGMDDGNIVLNEYISVLASEYRLLKDNGQPYNETLKELTYALLAQERLDCYSELYCRNGYANVDGEGNLISYGKPGANECYKYDDLNGFFLRDDASTSYWLDYSKHFFNLDVTGDGTCACADSSKLWPYFNFKYNIRSDFENGAENLPNFYTNRFIFTNHHSSGFECSSPRGYKGMSNDNIIHMWEALAMVKKLVDNESVYPINWITETLPDGSTVCPLRDKLMSRGILGSDRKTFYFSRWAADLAGRMYSYMERCGGTHFNPGDIVNPIFSTQVLEGSNKDGAIYAIWPFLGRANKDFFGNDIEDDWDPIREATFEYQLDHYYLPRSLGAISNHNPNDGNLYGRLRFPAGDKRSDNQPLLNMILYDKLNIFFGSDLYDDDYNVQLNYLKNLLNTAPTCGPRSYTDYGTSNDFINSNWIGQSRLSSIAKNGEDMANGDYKEYTGLDYMLLHNMFYLVFAKNPSAEKQNLVRTDNLNYNNLVRFRADRIFLKPGFHATPSGSTAKLHIYPYDRYKINSYQQVAYQLSPCDQIQQNNQNIIPSHTPINTLEDLITYQFPPQTQSKSLLDNKTDISDSNVDLAFSVYPNPVTSVVNISCAYTTSMTIEITNSLGSVIYNKTINDKSATVDLSSESAGIYFVKVSYNGNMTVQKIIKE